MQESEGSESSGGMMCKWELEGIPCVSPSWALASFDGSVRRELFTIVEGSTILSPLTLIRAY